MKIIAKPYPSNVWLRFSYAKTYPGIVWLKKILAKLYRGRIIFHVHFGCHTGKARKLHVRPTLLEQIRYKPMDLQLRLNACRSEHFKYK